ncbi:MAG: sodium:solute symporter family protein [Ignavibacteria bacterium]|nr:sodium:solute symporter family protein [Ignavibacteria bacterium]
MNYINFGIGDYIIVIIYFIICVYLGTSTKRTDGNLTDYLVAGRTITLPAFVATLVSTFYGGILGVGEFTFRYGISSWLLNALPYYIFILIFAFFFAEKIRKSELRTIPEKLEISFGKKVSLIGSIFIFFLTTPAPYLFMLGILVQMIFGLDLWVAMIISLFVSIIFLFRGGLKADVRVNILEFIIMFAGFMMILPFCFFKLGGIEYLKNNLSGNYFSLTGNHSTLYIIVWFFIGSWALVDPSFHQRCYAAKSAKVARNGVLISLIFWILFDFLTVTTGLYAASHLKNLNNPVAAYPALADSILPQFLKGFFFTSLLATIMSTFHSYLFISATTFGNDIMKSFPKFASRTSYIDLSKIGIVITSIISFIIPFIIPSVVEMWYTIGTLVIPPLLISILFSYFKKNYIQRGFILVAMISCFFVSLFWFIYGNLLQTEKTQKYLLDLEPLYPGLAVGILFILIGLVINLVKNEKQVV